MKKIILFKRKRRDEKDFEKFLERKGIINEKVEKERWLRDLKEDTLVWLLVSGIFTLLLVVIEVFR